MTGSPIAKGNLLQLMCSCDMPQMYAPMHTAGM